MSTNPLLTLLCASAILCGCTAATRSERSSPQTVDADTYCDRYLAYDMCVRDLDGNGEVDVMYFADTREVFMLTEAYRRRDIQDLTLHRCVQVMDDRVTQASSALLAIDDNTPSLQRAQVKSRLMLNYARYYPRIDRCMTGSQVVSLHESTESFGDEDFDELPEEWQ